MATSVKPDNKKMLDELLEAACHFGHKVSKWNPKMRKYLYTKREGIHIFDLTKTAESLVKVLEVLKDGIATGKTVLFVSTKLHTAKLVSDTAKKCGCSYVTRKWMPGLLTNFETIRKRIKYFKDLKSQKALGEWDTKYTKKERLELTRSLEKLEDAFSGVEDMTKLPDIMIVFDSLRDQLALREARKLNLTTIGICDSNADPDLVTHVIPGNDDAVKALKYFIAKMGDAIEIGRKLQVRPAGKE